jgi:glycosyltransferase involved in cell wall biosynthesis
VAGAFLKPEEEAEFRERIAQPDLALQEQGNTGKAAAAVTYAGFVSGTVKDVLFREADCYLFPTYYHAESFGLTIVEAMAYGLSVITTRWRAIPEVVPRDYPLLIEPRDATRAAELLLQLIAQQEYSDDLRRHFLQCFSSREHIRRLCTALESVEYSETS